MKYSCLYSIVRFAPHPDTEEFANVGIVLTAPAVGFMEYRLARKNWKRVNQFFECQQLFSNAIEIAQNELLRVRTLTTTSREAQIVNHFRYLTEPRESLIRFSQMRPILVDDLQRGLDDLYERFIERQTERKWRREDEMVKEIRGLFATAAIRSFGEETLTGELVKLHLPLVHRGEGIAAIKPLSFDQNEPGAIVEHSDHWVMRFRRANEERLISLNDVLIPVAAPVSDQTSLQRKAVTEARRHIRQNGLRLVEFEDLPAITEFARQFA